MRTHFTAWGLLALSLSLYPFPAGTLIGQAEAQDVSASAQAEAKRLSAAARNEGDDGPLEVDPGLRVAQATGEAPAPPPEKKGIISFNDAELSIVLKFIQECVVQLSTPTLSQPRCCSG